MFDGERATREVVSFLRGPGVGQMTATYEDGGNKPEELAEEPPPPPRDCIFPVTFFCLSFSFLFLGSPWDVLGAGKSVAPP